MEKSEKRKPLILKGVRQCGKTYGVTAFARKEFPRFHYVNFEQSPQLISVFTPDLDPKRIVKELQFYLDTQIDIDHDLLIFDEVQASPIALTSLKYFCEQLPSLALCAAGSLLGLELSNHSFPVGKVEFLPVYPLSFNEFLEALNDQKSLDFIQQASATTHIPDIVHQHLWRRLLCYFVTGGLPEVVMTFCEYQEDVFIAFQKVREKQSQVIATYYADIAKHCGKKNAMHVDRVWRSVPQQLMNVQDASAKRFQFSHVVPGIDRYQGLIGAIDWLMMAGLVIKTHINANAELPLLAFCKESLFKLYLSDVGLLGAMVGLPPATIWQYQYGTYKGYFAENFVAQEFLCATSEDLFCWQQYRSEIEFLRVIDADIIPIEVKSGRITRAKSLQKFIDLYSPPFHVILSGLPLQIDQHAGRYQLLLYMASQLRSPSILFSKN